MKKIKLLFLVVNPGGWLCLDEEIREITAKIRAAGHRDARSPVSRRSSDCVRHCLDRLTPDTELLSLLGMGKILQIDLPVVRAHVTMKTSMLAAGMPAERESQSGGACLGTPQ